MTEPRPDLVYEKLVAVMKPEDIDHHESDLYVRWTNASEKVLEECGKGSGLWVESFRDQITGKLWFDIPFAYTPFWEERARKQERMDVNHDV